MMRSIGLDCYIGIDIGTSNIKVAAINQHGEIISFKGKPTTTISLQPGFAEQSPESWWDIVCSCTHEVVNDLASSPDKKNYTIQSVGLSGQMHGLTALDKTGTPLRNSIVWLDGRSKEICREWELSGKNKELHNITGLSIATGYMAPSLAWVKKYEPEIYHKISAVLLPKDYIRFKLTDEISSERSDASGTYLFDTVNSSWSDTVISLFGFPQEIFPPIKKSLEIVGYITEEASRKSGLPKGTPVAAGGSDQAMAALSLGIDEPGLISVGLNTGATIITASEKPIFDNRIHTLCHAIDNRWLLMGATLTAGAAISWFLNNIIIQSQKISGNNISSIEKLTEMAAQIPPGSSGLIFSPHLTGIRTPHFNPNARGSFIGLNLSHTVNHMVRAIMEGTAFSMAETLDIFNELNLPIRNAISYAGGANSSEWRQIICDVFDLPLSKPKESENSVVGAALAGKAAIHGIEKITNPSQETMIRHTPYEKHVELYRRSRAIYKTIYKQLSDIYDSISLL
jgi:xylulokinase